jgi:hypothetical protein
MTVPTLFNSGSEKRPDSSIAEILKEILKVLTRTYEQTSAAAGTPTKDEGYECVIGGRMGGRYHSSTVILVE